MKGPSGYTTAAECVTWQVNDVHRYSACKQAAVNPHVVHVQHFIMGNTLLV